MPSGTTSGSPARACRPPPSYWHSGRSKRHHLESCTRTADPQAAHDDSWVTTDRTGALVWCSHTRGLLYPNRLGISQGKHEGNREGSDQTVGTKVESVMHADSIPSSQRNEFRVGNIAHPDEPSTTAPNRIQPVLNKWCPHAGLLKETQGEKAAQEVPDDSVYQGLVCHLYPVGWWCIYRLDWRRNRHRTWHFTCCVPMPTYISLF